jgi:Ser/Thr protein kinase RdoA (MazF antagonist)
VSIPDIEAALELWAETEGGRATLINVSENHTYRIDAPAGRFVLRLHRPGYQSAASIRSELDWLEALQGRLPVSRPLAGRDGEWLQQHEGRHLVLFAFKPGGEPAEDGDLVPLFRVLGRYAATLHRQAEGWQRPVGFTRIRWSAAAILAPDGVWGDWRQAPGARECEARLTALERRLRAELAAEEPGRYGLIHADMRLANLLVEGERVTLIDFDDCGFNWYLYDLAASLSLIETRPDLEALIAAWLEGYLPLRPLDARDRALIAPLILLRRMALLAWIGTHPETDLARRHGAGFAADTALLAERLLG